MKPLFIVFFASLFSTCYAQVEDYFEHLDHIESRRFFNLLPVSESESYVWTGNKLLLLNQEKDSVLYDLSFNSSGKINFFINDGDTTFIISNFFDQDVYLEGMLVLQKEGNSFSENFISSKDIVISEAVPLGQNSYLAIINFISIGFIDSSENIELLSETFSGLKLLTLNKQQDAFFLHQDDKDLNIYGVNNQELILLYQGQEEVIEFEVSNDSLAYLLTQNSIEVVDLKSGTQIDVIALDASFGTDLTFDSDENFDQFYVFSEDESAYINSYKLDGERTLLFSEKSLSPRNKKIVIRDSLIYTLANTFDFGHYKVQKNRLIEANNRKNLQLNSLEVSFLGIDTTIIIIPVNPPDTSFSFFNKYQYSLEVENMDTQPVSSYSIFSSVVRDLLPFQPGDDNIKKNYFDPIAPGQIQTHIDSFRTELNLTSLNFTLSGNDNMPDADCNNNFVEDNSIDIVSVRSTLQQAIEIDIYPSPAKDQISILCEIDIHRLHIYDSSGRQIYTKIQAVPIKSADISLIKPGIYFTNFFNIDGDFIGTKKLVKL